jgi:hypothetical protein
MSSQAPVKLPSSSRAGFVLVGSLCALLSVSLIAVVVIYSRPPMPTSHEALVDLGVPISKIALGQAIQFAAPSGTSFEMIDGRGFNRAGGSAAAGWLVHSDRGLLAFAVDSSHLGCPVNFDAAVGRFQDPCGGSFFALDGAVLRGPAMFPLSQLSWRKVGQNTIAVKTVSASG